MPSMRRMRVMGVMVLLFVVTVLWYTSTARQSRSGDIYTNTKAALKSNTQKVLDDDVLAGVLSERKKAADKLVAPNPAPIAGGSKPETVLEELPIVAAAPIPGEKGVAGRKKYPVEGEKVVEETKTHEDHEVEVEMNSILKRSPIIIFSKSYCPHSRRAKSILLEQYDIVPAPFVVELDLHPMGALLQAKLASMTGRKTVPNVLVSGKSIGGGDEVAAADDKGELASIIKSMTGKQMQKVQHLEN